jgi:hypothetical protein
MTQETVQSSSDVDTEVNHRVPQILMYFLTNSVTYLAVRKLITPKISRVLNYCI